MSVMLEVRDLNKRFAGLAAVQDVSFCVNAGEVVSLIGPNGAGKTTCFNLITGFLSPTSGSVHFEATDVTGTPPSRMTSYGVVRTFQKTNILRGLSVFENVLTAQHRFGVTSLWSTMFPGKSVRESERQLRDKACQIVDLVGLGDRLNIPASVLSCGELRLLEVAVALGAGPRLLMLDEPAAGLNSQEALKLASVLKGLVGTSIESLLLVEHNMTLVMAVSNRIVVMNFGKKLMEGTPEAVRNSPHVVEAYLGAGS